MDDLNKQQCVELNVYYFRNKQTFRTYM